jgi:glycosyltransferase involved in cell wall biosynthesis
VPSVAPLLQATDVFLCPLRVGGGVRLKMIEALSSGCAVVSTAIGA